MIGRAMVLSIGLLAIMNAAVAAGTADAPAPAVAAPAVAVPADAAAAPAAAAPVAAAPAEVVAAKEPEKPAGPPEVKGTIKGVAAGDQFLVDIAGSESEVRLYAADAPEEGQEFAAEAKKFAASHLLDKEVTLALLTTDSVGKTVVTIKYGDSNANFGLDMLAAGLAWWDQKNAPQARDEKGAGAKALAAKSGLFAKPAQLSPWDYRKAKQLPDYTYTVAVERRKSAFVDEDPLDKMLKAKQGEEPKEEETKSISAKGTEVYKGGFAVNISDLKINEDELKKLNPTQLLMDHFPTQAKNDAGEAIGLQVPGIAQLPYASMLGFQDGDIISSVNGVAINDPSQIMGLIPQFQGQGEFNVNVIRDGKPTTITIRP